jgi:hypothetical protein
MNHGDDFTRRRRVHSRTHSGSSDYRESLEVALQANRKLQTEVARQLQKIASQKAENRRMAAQLTERLVQCWGHKDARQTPIISSEGPSPKEALELYKNEKDELLKGGWNKSRCGKFKYDPIRRWSRQFFVDPLGSTPKPNQDTEKRRQLENGTFFIHTSPPWSTKQAQVLRECIEELASRNISFHEDVNFENVATMMQERSKEDDSLLILPKSAKEGRLFYEHSMKRTRPFTKEESLKILEYTHVSNSDTDWEAVAASLQNRTPWECFTHFTVKLRHIENSVWTIEQDEILLKYLAAMGPQFVLDQGGAGHIASRLLPDKTAKHVLGRANASLLNPNLDRDYWTELEEKKLTLCMKIYQNAEPSALNKASHHFPNRSGPTVTSKWNRSLNPDFTWRPLTDEEDRRILEAVRDSRDQGFAEIARNHFPNRYPQQIYDRWAETASEEDIVKKFGTKVLAGGVKRGLVKREKGALLSPEDFVVQVKKKTKRSSEK